MENKERECSSSLPNNTRIHAKTSLHRCPEGRYILKGFFCKRAEVRDLGQREGKSGPFFPTPCGPLTQEIRIICSQY